MAVGSASFAGELRYLLSTDLIMLGGMNGAMLLG